MHLIEQTIRVFFFFFTWGETYLNQIIRTRLYGTVYTPRFVISCRKSTSTKTYLDTHAQTRKKYKKETKNTCELRYENAVADECIKTSPYTF